MSRARDLSKNKFDLVEQSIKDLEEARSASLNLIEDLTEEIEKRKLVEKELQISRQRLQLHFEQTPLAVIEFDLSGNIIEWNPSAQIIFGYSREESLGQFMTFIVHESLWKQIDTVWDSIIKQKGGTRSSNQNITKDKRIIDCEWFNTPLIDQSGNTIGVASLIMDVTDKKSIDLALKESEIKFRNLFEHSPVGKSITGIDGSINVNKAFCNTLGYSEAELKSKNWREISHPDDIPMTDKFVKSLLAGESDSARFEKRYIHKNGSTIYTDIATYLQRNNTGDPEYFITTINDITDRKQTESRLLASEERYSLVISASKEGIWDWNIETNEVFFSEQWKKQIGYEDHEIENSFNSWIDLLHPDEKESCQFAVQSYLNNPVEHFILEFRFRHKDGSYRFIHNKSASIKNQDGRVLRMFGTHTDITENKLAEIMLREEQERIRTILDLVGDPIFVKDNDHRIILANQAFYDIFCLDENSVIGYTLVESVPKKERYQFLEVDRRVLDTGILDQREEELTVKDLTRTIITRKTRFIDESGARFLVGSIHDITDRKKAEDQLKISEEKFRSVIQSSPTGMHFYNLDDENRLILTGANPSADRILGIKHNELIGNTILEAFPNLAETHIPETYLNVALGIVDLQKFELKYGEERFTGYFDVTVFCTGQRSITVDFVDILDRKLAEQEVFNLNKQLDNRVKERTAQLEAANKELEAFSYSVSHDLRAPLRAIHSFTNILRQDYKDTLDDEGIRICSVIETSSVHMGELIDDLLAFSRIGRAEIQNSKIDMGRLAKSVCDDLTGSDIGNNVKIKIEKIPAAYGDYSTIKQVFVNLLSNAIKYSSKNETPEITVGYEKNKSNIVYYIRDNGVGFAMQYVDKLFKVFQRLHSTKEFDGNGVGLAIVHRIITKHGGSVWAEGEVGKGATVYFTLPVKLNDKL